MPLDAGPAGQQKSYLETIGRRTGGRHVIEIWFAADPERDRVYMLAGGRESSDWVLNMRANPKVRVRIGGQTFEGEAREIEGSPDEIRARHLVGAKYGYWREGTELRGWALDSLAVAIDLEIPGDSPT
ncbi:MAG: nitroreductase family deazaflavin-dependent oxidoreductase [Candidatus Limnocylindrales bacterium]